MLAALYVRIITGEIVHYQWLVF